MSIEKKIIDIIKANSCITVDEMMRQALSATSESYYRANQAIGRTADFITAPEISQMFGEMIAVWCILQWKKSQASSINIVELGAGRGTLMADVLRTIERIDPQFFNAIDKIIILEINPVLIEIQKQQLERFADKLDYIKKIQDLPERTSIIIANEFFDAMPIKQYKKVGSNWHEVVVKYQNNLYFCQSNYIATNPILKKHINAVDGAVFEYSEVSQQIMTDLCQMIRSSCGALLVIDYAYCYAPEERLASQYQPTLQAIKNHQFHPILQNLGQADLSGHVDFDFLRAAARQQTISDVQICTQKAFLQSLGIEHRLKSLVGQNPAIARNLDNQYHWLINKMGEMFLCLILSSF